MATAQRASRCEESADSPHGRNEQICAEERSRRTFDLFGLGDNAVAGLKTSAPDASFSVSNSDIGDQATLGDVLLAVGEAPAGILVLPVVDGDGLLRGMLHANDLLQR